MTPRPANARPEPDRTRRRVLMALAAAAGLPLAGAVPRAVDPPPMVRWRGYAMGAPAAITLCHPDRPRARRVLAACLAEIERLERIFSLYRRDSELAVLNRDGTLAPPSLDLVALLSEAARLAAMSGGAFDVTVQPLWRLYARHFAAPGADPGGPGPGAVARARALVDYRAVDVGPRRVRFARPGTAVTLNGIAQGAVTDRIADMLNDAGFDRVLVQLGEFRAGRAPPSRPWRLGIEDPRDPGRIADTVSLAEAALATSGGYGTRFEPSGRFHHLFDPATGGCADGCLSATAIAPRATLADGLATALAVGGPERAPALLRALGGTAARLVLADGRTLNLTAPEGA